MTKSKTRLRKPKLAKARMWAVKWNGKIQAVRHSKYYLKNSPGIMNPMSRPPEEIIRVTVIEVRGK